MFHGSLTLITLLEDFYKLEGKLSFGIHFFSGRSCLNVRLLVSSRGRENGREVLNTRTMMIECVLLNIPGILF
jgi:hypothetical protein